MDSLDERYDSLMARAAQVYPGLRLGRPVRSRVYWPVSVLLRLVRLRVAIEMQGQENVGPGAAIIVSNHQGTLDPVVVTNRTWWRVIAFTKVEWFEGRIAPFFRAYGQVPLRRGDEESTEWALDMCSFALDNGAKVGIYPEGTRGPSRTSLYRFHRRVLLPLLAGHPDVPVHACAVTYPDGGRFRQRARVRFSPQLPVDLRTMTDDEVITVLRDAVAELGGLTQENVYAVVAKARAARAAAGDDDGAEAGEPEA